MTWTSRLQQVIDSWSGTPYMPGGAVRGVGVDCVRFVDAVLMELHRLELPPLERLPQDMSLHDRRGAMRMCHAIASRYANEIVRSGEVEPGDVLVYRRGRAPGHVLIAGADARKLWHAEDAAGVYFTGMGSVRQDIMRVWRPTMRETW